jgi:hypothetical protein
VPAIKQNQFKKKRDPTMTQLRSFEIPTVMKHGLGAISYLADEVKALGLKRPLVVTDPGIVQAGLLDRAITILQAANLDYAIFDRVAPNPPIALVDARSVTELLASAAVAPWTRPNRSAWWPTTAARF